jgi:hypothetical protein
MQLSQHPLESTWRRLRPVVVVGAALSVLLSLVRWGGTASPGPLFVLGIALLAGMVLAFGLAVWWLYFSPLPGAVSQKARSPQARQLVAALALISGLLFVAGGVWDEAWHRRYGGFGEDFLWPPHLLLYFSLLLMALFAYGGMVTVLLKGSGGLRERFRAEPLIGLLGLVSSYLVLSLPIDELWHRIYGPDLTAWSLPHLIIAGGVTLVMLVAVSLQLSVVPKQGWQGLRGLRWQEVLALLLTTSATLVLLQIGTTEWEGITSLREGAGDAFRDAFWRRPEWLYPVVVASIALFSGSFAIHALRRAGAATLVALFVLGFRLLSLLFLEAGSGSAGLGFVSHLLILPPMLALDLWYARKQEKGEMWGHALAAAVFLAIALPLIDYALVYPRVTAATAPGMIFMSLVMALAAGWAGGRLGAWLGGLQRRGDGARALGMNYRVRWMAAGTLGAALAVVLAIVLTARAPL